MAVSAGPVSRRFLVGLTISICDVEAGGMIIFWTQTRPTCTAFTPRDSSCAHAQKQGCGTNLRCGVLRAVGCGSVAPALLGPGRGLARPGGSELFSTGSVGPGGSQVFSVERGVTRWVSALLYTGPYTAFGFGSVSPRNPKVDWDNKDLKFSASSQS